MEVIDTEELPTDGKGLRAKLEEALAEKRELQAELAALRAREVVREKGLDLVKPDDLKGVALDQLEQRAVELQQERERQQRELVRAALTRKGLSGTALDEAVEAFLAGDSAAEGGDGEQDVAGVAARVGGAPVRADQSDLHGVAAIEAALSGR